MCKWAMHTGDHVYIHMPSSQRPTSLTPLGGEGGGGCREGLLGS